MTDTPHELTPAELAQGQADADALAAEFPDTVESLLAELADDIPHRRAQAIAADYLARHRVIVFNRAAAHIEALPQDHKLDPGRGEVVTMLRAAASLAAAIAAPSATMGAAGAEVPATLIQGIAQAPRPAGLDALLGYVADNLPDAETCTHPAYEVTNAHSTPAGWVKGRRCVDCRAILDPITEEPCTDPRHTGPIRAQLGCTGPDPAEAVEEQPAELSWKARADHAVELYARTAIERDDARTEAAKLRARVAELEAELRIGAPWTCNACGKENRRNVCAVCETDRPDADDDQAEEQPAPAFRFPQLAVPCPRCEAPAGQLCTSHNGTRTRTSDVHQARTAAHRAQEAGR